jgi:hypothetical protein
MTTPDSDNVFLITKCSAQIVSDIILQLPASSSHYLSLLYYITAGYPRFSKHR